MRLRIVALFAPFLLAALLGTATAGTVIDNLGDFEDGTAGQWQVTWLSAGGGLSVWAVSSGSTSPLSASPTYLPTGAFQMVSDWLAPGSTAILYRDVTIPANADTLRLRLWYKSASVAGMPSLTPGGSTQGLRVDLQSSAASVTSMTGILGTMFATSLPSNASDDLSPTTVLINVQSLRGQTVRLRLAAMSNSAAMIAGVDDVQLVGTQYTVVANTGLPNLTDGAADWGDFDDDGDLDLAIEGTDGTAWHADIYRNDGTSFSLYASAPGGFVDGDVKWVDIDRDGRLDVFFSGVPASANRSSIGRNTGSGFTWDSPVNYGFRSNLALCDFDGDGDQDVLTHRPGTGALVHVNDGTSDLLDMVLTDIAPLDSAFVYWKPGFPAPPYPGFTATGRSTGGTPMSSTFRNDNQGATFTRTSTDSATAAACVLETGNGRGYTFTSGRIGRDPRLVSRITFTSGGGLIPSDIPGLYDAAAGWTDDNLDGYPDLFVAGNNNGAAYAGLHRNNAGASFGNSGSAFTPMTHAACALGDYDDDGDVDILELGTSNGVPVTKLWRNDLATPNSAPGAPGAPAGFVFDPGTTGLTLMGNSVFADDHSFGNWATFNFRAGGVPGGADIIVPDSDPVTGHRRVARPGNGRGDWYYTMSTNAVKLVHSPIYFATQGVDLQFKGGPWSPEYCVVLGPKITSITDVPNDQGGAVRITMNASRYDVANSAFPATIYNVYGRITSAALAAQVASAEVRAADSEEGGLPTVTLGDRRFVAPAAAQAAGFPAGAWEILTSFAAYRSPTYTVRVNTVADSGASGPNWSAFVASVHTNDSAVWWTSPADSGKSLDNIAPGAPQGVQLSYHPGTHNALSWQPSAAEDFQYFRVYRGATPNFAIGAATLVGSTSDVSWLDPAAGATGVYYKITALDHAGNESVAASPTVTTDVDGGAAPSYAFALATPSPSPFATRTAIAFTLPAAQHARLEVFDAAGRRVAKLADGTFAAGPHSVTWDGSAEGGARANAGLLFVRLSAGGREAVRRVVLLGSAN